MNKIIRKCKRVPIDYPIANKSRRIHLSRFNLFEKTNGVPQKCHWCGISLVWRTGNSQLNLYDSMCVDHLDNNVLNDSLDNLVPSCRACNANRNSHGNGRKKLKNCKYCNVKFWPKNNKSIFCSNYCSSKGRKKKPITMKHGTRSLYTHGCRCNLCRNANAKYSRLNRRYSNYKCHGYE
jgi:hypothetical protein